MTKLLQTFIAKDAAGKPHKLLVYGTYEIHSAYGQPDTLDLASQSIFTVHREPVNAKGGGVYEVIAPMGNVLLTTEDATAPGFAPIDE